MGGAFGEPLTSSDYHRYLRILMVQETGWSLDHIDGMGFQDWLDYWAVRGAQADLIAFGREQG